MHTLARKQPRESQLAEDRASQLVLDSLCRGSCSSTQALAALRALPADARDALLDEALSLTDAAASPAVGRRWTPRFSRRWPVRMPSRRAALSGFGRLMARMEEVTARTAHYASGDNSRTQLHCYPQVEPGTGQRFKEGDAPRRRRFLLTLLRQSAESGGVHRVEP